MSNDKIISIEDESPHSHFTCIPNIIFEIGLKPVDLAVYSAIKRCAGDHGNCTRSYKNIAKLANTSERTAIDSIARLCTINPIVHKSLLKKKKRLSEHGDSETNCIVVTDLWTENHAFYNESNVGGAKSAPPSAKSAPGVVQNLHQGGAKSAPKEEPFKKNPFKKTTTPTPFKGEEVVGVVVSKDIEEEGKKAKSAAAKEAAQSLKTWMDKEANKTIKIKDKYGGEDHKKLGDDWIFPIELYEQKISEYGIAYFQDQLHYTISKQKSFFNGKSKKGIDLPETYLRRSCNDNYAESTKIKKEKL